MKRLLLILLLAAVPSFALAVDIVSDPLAPGVNECGVYVDSTPYFFIPTTTTSSGEICEYDVTFISNGAHTVSMTARLNDPVWGLRESVKSVPLDFVKPGPPVAPVGVRLEP